MFTNRAKREKEILLANIEHSICVFSSSQGSICVDPNEYSGRRRVLGEHETREKIEADNVRRGRGLMTQKALRVVKFLGIAASHRAFTTVNNAICVISNSFGSASESL
jgi:hypothetical protein